MKVVSYEDDSGRTAMPSGHSDLTALITAGPWELDLIRRASQRPSQLDR
jgi:membrane-associated phospholipid phosphatase